MIYAHSSILSVGCETELNSFSGESFSSFVSARKKRSPLAQSFKNAAAFRPERIWLFSSDLHFSRRHVPVEKCLGQQQLEPEVDNKACELYFGCENLIVLFLFSIHTRDNKHPLFRFSDANSAAVFLLYYAENRHCLLHEC